MEIKTKYDIGQEVYWLENGEDEVQCGKVYAIKLEPDRGKNQIWYVTYNEQTKKYAGWHIEHIFDSKERLQEKVDYLRERNKEPEQITFFDKEEVL